MFEIFLRLEPPSLFEASSLHAFLSRRLGFGLQGRVFSGGGGGGRGRRRRLHQRDLLLHGRGGNRGGGAGAGGRVFHRGGGGGLGAAEAAGDLVEGLALRLRDFDEGEDEEEDEEGHEDEEDPRPAQLLRRGVSRLLIIGLDQKSKSK